MRATANMLSVETNHSAGIPNGMVHAAANGAPSSSQSIPQPYRLAPPHDFTDESFSPDFDPPTQGSYLQDPTPDPLMVESTNNESPQRGTSSN